MRVRPVAPRARRMADIVASVPLETMRTFSQDGTRSVIASASRTSRSVGAPYEVPSPAARPDGFDDLRVGVPGDDRPVGLHEVEVGGALDVPDPRSLGPGHEVRRAADGPEGPHRRVHPAGDDPLGSLEQRLVRSPVSQASAASRAR